VTTEFSGPKVRKIALLSFWSQLGTKFVEWQLQKFEKCSCRKVNIKMSSRKYS